MHVFVMFFAALLAAVAVYHLMTVGPRRPAGAGDWGALENKDPRVAAGAMLYAVACETGAFTKQKRDRIITLLIGTVGLTPDVAHQCLAAGRRIADRLDGDLNSRLHQLRDAIERGCSPQERQDVIEMLRTVAGDSAERNPSVRQALGRLSGSLLHG